MDRKFTLGERETTFSILKREKNKLIHNATRLIKKIERQSSFVFKDDILTSVAHFGCPYDFMVLLVFACHALQRVIMIKSLV